jgi:hypothetical protein
MAEELIGRAVRLEERATKAIVPGTKERFLKEASLSRKKARDIMKNLAKPKMPKTKRKTKRRSRANPVLVESAVRKLGSVKGRVKSRRILRKQPRATLDLRRGV